MIVLLSPAKTLDYENPNVEQVLTDHIFPKESMQLVRLMRKKKKPEIKDLMHISDALADLNYQRFKSFSKEYPLEASKAAIEAFKGDVYVGLDYPTLSKSEVTFAQSHVRILSGLYGLLRPLDKMQAYRLEMGTRLENKAGSNLYHFWGDKISKALNKQLKQMDNNLIINLASNEYFKAVDKKTIKAEIVEANFKEYHNGTLKFISFNAKKARGLMTRYIIQNKVSKAEELKGFDTDGYYYSEEHSTSNSLMFIR